MVAVVGGEAAPIRIVAPCNRTARASASSSFFLPRPTSAAGDGARALLHTPFSLDILNCSFTHEHSVIIADSGNHCIRLLLARFLARLCGL